MFAKTRTRVEAHTPPEIVRRIRRRAEDSVALYAGSGPALIQARLERLDEEWDIERVLEANATAFSLLGLALGRYVDRRWYALPAVVTGFLLMHALQGWCPPLPLFRRLGVRTSAEIEWERESLKAARGDYVGLCASELEAEPVRSRPGPGAQDARRPVGGQAASAASAVL